MERHQFPITQRRDPPQRHHQQCTYVGGELPPVFHRHSYCGEGGRYEYPTQAVDQVERNQLERARQRLHLQQFRHQQFPENMHPAHVQQQPQQQLQLHLPPQSQRQLCDRDYQDICAPQRVCHRVHVENQVKAPQRLVQIQQLQRQQRRSGCGGEIHYGVGFNSNVTSRSPEAVHSRGVHTQSSELMASSTNVEFDSEYLASEPTVKRNSRTDCIQSHDCPYDKLCNCNRTQRNLLHEERGSGHLNAKFCAEEQILEMGGLRHKATTYQDSSQRQGGFERSVYLMAEHRSERPHEVSRPVQQGHLEKYSQSVESLGRDELEAVLSRQITRPSSVHASDRNDVPIKVGTAQEFFTRLQREDAALKEEGNQRQKLQTNTVMPKSRFQNQKSQLPHQVYHSHQLECDAPRHTPQHVLVGINESAPGGRSGNTGYTYIDTDQLEDFGTAPNPRFIVDSLLPRLQVEPTKGDWTQQVNDLTTLRRIAKFYPRLLSLDVVRRLAAAVLALLGSPRSAVAKTAAIALCDLFRFGQTRMEAAVTDVVEMGMRKSSQSNEFLNEAVRAVLLAVCEYSNEYKVTASLIACISLTKNCNARAAGVGPLAFMLQRMGTRAQNFKELQQLFRLLLQTSGEASPDLRIASRIALKLLLENVGVSHLRHSGSSVDDLRKAEGMVLKVSDAEVTEFIRSLRAHASLSAPPVAERNKCAGRENLSNSVGNYLSREGSGALKFKDR